MDEREQWSGLRSVMLTLVVTSGALGCGTEAPPDRDSVARGEKLSVSCATCHSVKSRVNRVGPSLWGVIDRRAGAVIDYDYSVAMRSAGIVWTPETMERFLLDPLGLVPGTKMALGTISERDAKDVVAYLRSLSR